MLLKLYNQSNVKLDDDFYAVLLLYFSEENIKTICNTVRLKFFV